MLGVQKSLSYGKAFDIVYGVYDGMDKKIMPSLKGKVVRSTG
jgi:hypothetical protein